MNTGFERRTSAGPPGETAEARERGSRPAPFLPARNDRRAAVCLPAQGLPAAVAVGLKLPLQRDAAPGAERITVPVLKHAPLGHPHGCAEGPRGPAPVHSTSAAAEKGLRSSTSSASAMRHSSLMVGLAFPCSIRRR